MLRSPFFAGACHVPAPENPMTHLDRRIYAGTALVAAIAATAVLYVTHPVDLQLIETANATDTRVAPMTWKGVRNVVMHEPAAAEAARLSDK